MSATWVVADLHLGHQRICEFVDGSGRKVRPFATAAEMDETIVANWNARVRVSDKVYVLGDVAIRKQALPTLSRLNGKLRLIRGNHDIFKTKQYMAYFGEVYGCRILDGCILTHIPIHPQSVTRYGLNIHGHLHSNNIVTNPSIRPEWRCLDSRYLCVSLEQVDYRPITLEEAFARAAANGYSRAAA